jgi:hypothetical protein
MTRYFAPLTIVLMLGIGICIDLTRSISNLFKLDTFSLYRCSHLAVSSSSIT